MFSLIKIRKQRRRVIFRRRLMFELFEPRLPLTTNFWIGSSDGDWSVDANWSLGRTPTDADDVVLNAPDNQSNYRVVSLQSQSEIFGDAPNLQFDSANVPVGTYAFQFVADDQTISSSPATSQIEVIGLNSTPNATVDFSISSVAQSPVLVGELINNTVTIRDLDRIRQGAEGESTQVGQSFARVANAQESTNIEVKITPSSPSISFVSFTQPQLGTFDMATGIWTIPSLNLFFGAELRFQTRGSVSGTYSIESRIQSTVQPDRDTTNNVSVASVVINPVPPVTVDLSISSVAQSPVLVGDAFGKTITLQNLGQTNATDIEVKITPSSQSLNISSYTQPQLGTFNLATGIWKIPSLPPSATAHLVIQASGTVSGTYSIESRIQSTAQPDRDTTNNVSVVSVVINSPVRPEPTKVSSYRTEFEIRKNSPAFTIRGEDVFRASRDAMGSFEFTSIKPASGTTGGKALIESGSISFVPDQNFVGTYILGVSAIYTDQFTQQLTVTDSVRIAVVGDQSVREISGLRIEQSISNLRPTRNELVSFKIRVVNEGHAGVREAKILQSASAVLQGTRVTKGLQHWDPLESAWRVPTIGAFDSVEYEFDGFVITPNPIISVASVEVDPAQDSDMSNNASTLILQPRSASVAVSVVPLTTSIVQGDTGVVKIYVQNGAETVSNFTLYPGLDAGVEISEATSSAGSFDTALQKWTIPELAPNQLIVIEFKVSSDYLSEISIAPVVDSSNRFLFSSGAESIWNLSRSRSASVSISNSVPVLNIRSDNESSRRDYGDVNSTGSIVGRFSNVLMYEPKNFLVTTTTVTPGESRILEIVSLPSQRQKAVEPIMNLPEFKANIIKLSPVGGALLTKNVGYLLESTSINSPLVSDFDLGDELPEPRQVFKPRLSPSLPEVLATSETNDELPLIQESRSNFMAWLILGGCSVLIGTVWGMLQVWRRKKSQLISESECSSEKIGDLHSGLSDTDRKG